MARVELQHALTRGDGLEDPAQNVPLSAWARVAEWVCVIERCDPICGLEGDAKKHLAGQQGRGGSMMLCRWYAQRYAQHASRNWMQRWYWEAEGRTGRSGRTGTGGTPSFS